MTNLHEKNSVLIDKLGRARINAGLLFGYLELNPIIDILNIKKRNLINKFKIKIYLY